MYINFWYPIALEKDLIDDKPLQSQVMGVKLVTFKDASGQPTVLADTCVHRGASLSEGWVEDGKVVCPYHGWQYDGGGKCVHIPSLASSAEKIPARAKVDSYPTEVKYGIVFAFLGDVPAAERPPIAWEAPELDDPEWSACDIHVFDVDYNYERSVENGLDPAHNEYVHPNQGAPTPTRDWRKDPIDIIKEDFASHFTLRFVREGQGLLGKDAAGVIEEGKEVIIAGSGHMGPNSVVTWINPGPGRTFRQYFFEAPINDEKTRIFFLTTRSYMIDPDFDEDIMEINLQIAMEDVGVVKNLDPIRAPSSNIKEVLMPTDAPVISYREYLKSWKDKGWKIDFKKMKELKGDVAMAIPCPERRTSKGWVLDVVPMVAAE
jgi:phenylpropionate dioxygenase-like ring-hydroxylating dioxygenase large terminal subunit